MTQVVGLDAFDARLRALPDGVQVIAQTTLESFQGDITGYMGANAPWQDRTGAARRNLHAWVVGTATGAILYVGHGVPYGVNLELGHQGRFAILWPAIRAFKVPILAQVRANLAKAFGGQWTAAT